MTSNPSFTQLVTQVLKTADHPLTITETKARTEMVRSIHARMLQTTITPSRVPPWRQAWAQADPL